MNPRIYNEILKALKLKSVVTMTDYSQYEAEKSNDGGAYSFTQRYEKLDNGMWKLSFHTSSSFDYCSCCGTFHNGECSCNRRYEEVSPKKLARILSCHWEDPDYYEIIIK